MGNEDKFIGKGITDGQKIVSYVANKRGRQELVQGSMWHPVNVVNRQAWQEIDDKIKSSKEKVTAGQVSCLHYYMTANQMDTSLLASYTGQPRWLVCLHMVPYIFRRLQASTLGRYCEIFKVSPSDLRQGKLKPPYGNQGEHEAQPVD